MLPTPNLGYLSGKSLARVRQQLTCLPITYLIQPPPQSEALTTPTYLKRWSGADPPLSRSSLLEDPGCPSSLPNQTGIFGIKGGSWCRRCGGTAPTVPLPSVCVCVCQRPGVLGTSMGKGDPPSPPPSPGRPAPHSRIICPMPGHLGHLYQGAWVVGGYHPLQCWGSPPPPPSWGTGT